MKKILIVDDDEDLLTLLKSFMQREGFQTEVSTTCDEGISMFYEGRPDIVLLDINVGKEDGRDVCREIRKNKEFLNIPVIILSANAKALSNCGDIGANAFVAKPFTNQTLLKLISKQLHVA